MTQEADERFLIENIFGPCAHMIDWNRDCRRIGEALIRERQPKRRRRQRAARPPDGLLTASEAAAKLRCSIKTLNGHVAARSIKYVIIGHGTKRPRKMFTDADLNQFIANQTREDSPCPSSVPRARVTGTSISGTKVIAFTAQPRPPIGAKPKK
jgi:hypothetical protein